MEASGGKEHVNHPSIPSIEFRREETKIEIDGNMPNTDTKKYFLYPAYLRAITKNSSNVILTTYYPLDRNLGGAPNSVLILWRRKNSYLPQE
jgi:hypothetical protein